MLHSFISMPFPCRSRHYARSINLVAVCSHNACQVFTRKVDVRGFYAKLAASMPNSCFSSVTFSNKLHIRVA